MYLNVYSGFSMKVLYASYSMRQICANIRNQDHEDAMFKGK